MNQDLENEETTHIQNHSTKGAKDTGYKLISTSSVVGTKGSLVESLPLDGAKYTGT